MKASRAVCPAHVSDAYLRERIATSATEPSCSYCPTPASTPIFNGATHRATANSEAGAHAAHRFVASGEFTPTRELRLIDLTNLHELPSIFDAAAHGKFFVGPDLCADKGEETKTSRVMTVAR